MSVDSLNFIIQNLNSPPFNCNTSLIAFDLWSPNTLLQTLSDVISWITQSPNIDVLKETADETALRLLHHLKILKFEPPSDVDDLEEWRSGLVEGAKRSVYPVLFYLFSNIDALKQRAYLAKYLVKVEIPSDVHDVDTQEMQNELAQLMERFKVTHASVLDVQQDTMLIEDIKADLKSMTLEKEVLSRKIEKTMKKIENLPSLKRQMAAAVDLRIQKNRLNELEMQRFEQRDGMISTEKKIQRLKDQLAELRSISENLDPTNLIAQLEDDIATNTYLLEVKLSAEREQKRQVLNELARVSSMPAIEQADINRLQAELEAKTNEIMELEKERDKDEESTDENFSIFRHQALGVERRKDAVAEKVQEARHELGRLQQQVDQRKDVLRSTTGAEVMSAHQFKTYVGRIRDKKVIYKKKKMQIEELLTEREVLLRTMNLLPKNVEQLEQKIEGFGVEPITVPSALPSSHAKIALPETTDVEELRGIVTNLVQDLDQRRDTITELKKRRSDLQEVFNGEEETFDSKKAEYESRRAHLNEEFEELKPLIQSLEERQEEAEKTIPQVEEQINEAEKQLSAFNSAASNPDEDLKAQLEEEQAIAESLLQNNGSQITDYEAAKKQMILWKSLLSMFEAKIASTNEDQNLGNEDS